MDQIEQLKDLLSESKHRIKLNDFMVQATKATVLELSQPRFSAPIPENQVWVSRLRDYESVVGSMLNSEILLGRWEQRPESQVATIPLRRIAGDLGRPSGGNSMLAVKWYPVCLLLYAGFVGAVAGDNYEKIHKLAHISLPNHRGGKNDDVLLSSVFKAMGQINNVFQLLPVTGQTYAPRSERIYRLLEAPADDMLYLGPEYERLFDRVEIIMSLEYIHIEHPEKISEDDRIWAPVGRFGWKDFDSNPLSELMAQATATGDNWPPLRAGLFGGSSPRLLELVGGLKRSVNRWS